MLHVGVSVVHVVAVIVFMLWIPGSTCQDYTIVVSRAAGSNNDITLSCNRDGTTMPGATFFRLNGDIETSVSNTFTINETTEGIYFCRKDVSKSNEQPINAFPTTCTTIPSSDLGSGMWGQNYTAKCPCSVGALAMKRPDLYSITWTVIYSTSDTVNLNSSTSEYTLDGSNIIISRFTPFVQSLVCTLTVTGIPSFQGSNNVVRRGFLENIASNNCSKPTSIVEAPLKSTVKAGYSAEFQCTATVPQLRTVMFEVFGGNIRSSKPDSCNTSLTTQICTDSIEDHPVTLTCDYSVGFQISCTLRIDNFTESQPNNVSCKIMNGNMVEASKTVGRIVEVDKLKPPETSRMENGNLMLNISLPDNTTLSKFIDKINVTVIFEPAQDNCENQSYTAEFNNQTLLLVISKTDSCIPQESFRVKVKAPFTNNFSELSDLFEIPQLPTSSVPTITTTTTTTTTTTPATIFPSVTSTPATTNTLPPYLYAILAVGAVILIVLVIVIVLLVLLYSRKKKKHSPDATDISSNREMHTIHDGQYAIYRPIPQNSPQRSVTPSDDPELGSLNPTEITGLPSSQDSTPSHYSSRSSRCSRSNHSHHSQCTCTCHNSYSGSHLEPPKTLPLARYGYPDVGHSQYPYNHHEQSSIDGAPRLKVIPPTPGTPNTPGTEPFSVPSPGTPNQSRPQNLKFNSASTPGYVSTPVSNEVAVSIAMYLMHRDCPNKANCPTCNLIDNQFHHLMNRYEHSHSKNENRQNSRLKRRRSMKGTPKSLNPPTLGRQRSLSSSHVNADELTLSSNEDSSTDPDPVTKPKEPGRYRQRDFSPLPLSALPRDLTAYASDSELAPSPSGHVPSPRRQLCSPTKIHLKPSTAPPPPIETRLPSSDSLPTDESETSSRQGSDSYDVQGSDSYDVQGSLPLPSQRRSFSGTSGYETVTSSDTESLFLPNKQFPLEVRSSTDTETYHKRRYPDRHHHSHSRRSPATRSLQNAPRQGGLNPSQLGSDYHSNESFNSSHSTKSAMVHHSYYHDRQDYQRPSSSSPCRSSRRADHGYGGSTSFITLPHASSQQTDL